MVLLLLLPQPILPQFNAAAAKSLQNCPTLCDPMDCSPPGFSVHGISQARILEWVAMLSSRGIFLTQESNIWKFTKQHRFCTKISFKIKYL